MKRLKNEGININSDILSKIPLPILQYQIINRLEPIDIISFRRTGHESKRTTQPLIDQVKKCNDDGYFQNKCISNRDLERIKIFKYFDEKLNLDETNNTKGCDKYCNLYLQNSFGFYKFFNKNYHKSMIYIHYHKKFR